jgi:hypothetical protein
MRIEARDGSAKIRSFVDLAVERLRADANCSDAGARSEHHVERAGTADPAKPLHREHGPILRSRGSSFVGNIYTHGSAGFRSFPLAC